MQISQTIFNYRICPAFATSNARGTCNTIGWLTSLEKGPAWNIPHMEKISTPKSCFKGLRPSAIYIWGVSDQMGGIYLPDHSKAFITMQIANCSSNHFSFLRLCSLLHYYYALLQSWVLKRAINLIEDMFTDLHSISKIPTTLVFPGTAKFGADGNVQQTLNCAYVIMQHLKK